MRRGDTEDARANAGRSDAPTERLEVLRVYIFLDRVSSQTLIRQYFSAEVVSILEVSRTNALRFSGKQSLQTGHTTRRQSQGIRNSPQIVLPYLA